MKLLLRPNPISGESWPGYLLRLAETNNYQGIDAIAKILRKTPLAVIGAPPMEILEALQIATPAHAAPPLANRHTRSLVSVGRPVNAKVCAMCLPEMDIPYLKSDWDRAFAFECRVHGILLTEACHACGNALTHLRGHIVNCDCGYRLSHTPTRRPDALISRILDVLHLHSNYVKITATFACSNEQDLIAQRLLLWLARLDAGHFGRPSRYRAVQAYVSLADICKLSHLFADWPNAFIKRANEIQLRTRYSVRSLIFMNGNINSRGFPMITEALDAIAMDRRNTLRPRRSIGLETALLNSTEFVTMKFLETATGCPPNIVRHWMHMGWLGTVQTIRTKHQVAQYKIPREAASKAIQLIRSTASARELAKTVGIRTGPLRYLARYGLLQGLPYGKAKWSIRLVPEEVFQLTTKLLAATKFRHSALKRLLLLEDAIWRLSAGRSALIQALIRAVLDRQIPTYVFDKHPTRIDQISLEVADFVSWRTQAMGGK